MLVPGKPAVSVLQMGDRIVTWNGIEMFDGNKRKLLKEVVTEPAESHVLLIERARSPTIDGYLARDPLTAAELNVDDDKEETLLFAALAVAILAFVASVSGTLSNWVPR
eukprot:6282106-Prymnesium_polylepis.1